MTLALHHATRNPIHWRNRQHAARLPKVVRTRSTASLIQSKAGRAETRPYHWNAEAASLNDAETVRAIRAYLQ